MIRMRPVTAGSCALLARYAEVTTVTAGMILEFIDRDVLVKACFGAQSILTGESQVEAFRAQVDETGNLVTSLRRFVVWTTVTGELPVMLLMYRSGVIWGVALLCLRRKRGIPTGVVSAGDDTGQGGVIATHADRIAVLETAARVLMRIPFIHTVVLSTVWSETIVPNDKVPSAETGGHWRFRKVGFRLDLSGGQEATMARLGYKMRRNLGYYRRRAEARLGCMFLPALLPEQRIEAVEALSDKGTYRISNQKSQRLDAVLAGMPRSFAMGIQNASGEWLSYLAGWHGLDGTYLDRQLNREEPADASFSTVMRSYFLDEELGRGSPAIVFVGGTAPFWSRVCVPAVCGELLIVRPGLINTISGHLARRFSPSGKVTRLRQRTDPFVSTVPL